MSENGRLKDSELAPTLLGGRLTKAAADSADRMFTKFGLDGLGVLQAVSPADTYRTYEQQVEARARVGNLAAEPGTSNHGWGLATDFRNGMNSWGSSAQAWFARYGDDFGWVTPGWADPNSDEYQKNEPWHKEYVESRDKHRGPKIRRPKAGEVGIGSEGAKALRIQILLNQRLDGPNLIVDGRFGLGTAIAAAKFQDMEGLAVSGSVGDVTLERLEDPNSGARDYPYFLKPGTQKEDQVENLQRFLRRMRSNRGLDIDGVYGKDTVAAVKRWQEKADLNPHGNIGPQSRARLVELGVDL